MTEKATHKGKPIILVPRRAALGEHRNDHQLATVRQLAERPGILIAHDETELPDRIAEGLTMNARLGEESPTARRLNDALAAFIEGRPI